MGRTVVEGVVNHCLLEVVVLEAPQVRYTQDNQTPVAEMAVELDGLRPDDPPGQLKVVGWGNLAQDLQNRVQVGQRLMIEGRLRMSTVSRADGTKEKRAEFTLARLHPLTAQGGSAPAPSVAPSMAAATAQGAPVRTIPRPAPAAPRPVTPAPRPAAVEPPPPTWNTSPLVPDLADDDDEIPF
jgi:single-stranded DNA-binding protein